MNFLLIKSILELYLIMKQIIGILLLDMMYQNISRPRMTQYEKALVLGKKATQISGGSKPNITVKVGMTVQEIATEELRQKKVPFIIKRPIGSSFEYWKIADLFVNLD